MKKDIEALEAKFLAADLDEEDRQANEEDIRAWKADIRQLEAFSAWRDLDITKQIAETARTAYKDLSMLLIENRDMTEKQRLSTYAKQDAAKWILSLTEKDAPQELERIHAQIRAALNATN